MVGGREVNEAIDASPNAFDFLAAKVGEQLW
jgi:hypothetical protein